MGAVLLVLEAFKAGSKVWDLWVRSIGVALPDLDAREARFLVEYV